MGLYASRRRVPTEFPGDIITSPIIQPAAWTLPSGRPRELHPPPRTQHSEMAVVLVGHLGEAESRTMVHPEAPVPLEPDAVGITRPRVTSSRCHWYDAKVYADGCAPIRTTPPVL